LLYAGAGAIAAAPTVGHTVVIEGDARGWQPSRGERSDRESPNPLWPRGSGAGGELLRKRPVYNHAVENGRIVDNEWLPDHVDVSEKPKPTDAA
jgi:hypothetical protein